MKRYYTVFIAILLSTAHYLKGMNEQPARHITMMHEEATDSEDALTPRTRDAVDRYTEFQRITQTMTYEAISADRKRRNFRKRFICIGSSVVCFSLSALCAATIIYLKQLNFLCS